MSRVICVLVILLTSVSFKTIDLSYRPFLLDINVIAKGSMIDQGPAKKTAKVDQTINLKVVQNLMKFDKELLEVKAGSTVQILFENPDFMQHNFVLIKPNTMDKVGEAVDKMASDPNGAKMSYVPKLPEILQSMPLVNPQGKFTLTFKAPATAGDYPYICTFPGHWRIMKGVMKVTK